MYHIYIMIFIFIFVLFIFNRIMDHTTHTEYVYVTVHISTYLIEFFWNIILDQFYLYIDV